jgi:hypothetical protein
MDLGEATDMLQGLFMVEPDEPFSAIEDFGASGSQMTRDGEEEVRGQKTVRYAGRVEAADLQNAADRIEGDVLFELWLDHDNLPARLRMSYEFDALYLFEPIPGETPRVVVTIEWFDWGQPVDIQAPPADKIVDIDDFAGGSDPTTDYFAGADCYGDAVDDCLEPNPELGAGAADPALCQGAEARVCLVPVGNVRTDVVDAIVKFHKGTANIDVVVLPSIPLTAADIHHDTSQVDADTLYEALERVYGVGDLTPSTFIAITPIDVRPRDGEYGWVFGSRWGRDANGAHNHGVFSYFRMANVEPYDGSPLDDDLLHLRVAKYAARYVALLYLDYPYSDDIEQLNYRDMFGFSDLDSMGTTWPSGPLPCAGDEPRVCLVPDGMYEDEVFVEDLKLVADRLSKDLGIRVEVRNSNTSYYPSRDSWSEEYYNDLHSTISGLISQPNITVIGVTDDALSQASGVPAHVDRAWPAEHFAVASGYDAGAPGTDLHRQRLYNVLLRTIAGAHYGKVLDQDPASLLYADVGSPVELDGKQPPSLP